MILQLNLYLCSYGTSWSNNWDRLWAIPWPPARLGNSPTRPCWWWSLLHRTACPSQWYCSFPLPLKCKIHYNEMDQSKITEHYWPEFTLEVPTTKKSCKTCLTAIWSTKSIDLNPELLRLTLPSLSSGWTCSSCAHPCKHQFHVSRPTSLYQSVTRQQCYHLWIISNH